MSRLVAIFGFIFLIVYATSALAKPLRINAPGPDFTAFDSQGRLHSLRDYAGKIVVLEWTSHECPYTARQYNAGVMQDMQKMAAENGIIWFSVISAGPGEQGYADAMEANKIADARNAAPYAILLDQDGAVGQLYNAKVTPQFYIFDREGRIAYMGAVDSNPSPNWSGDKRPVRNFVLEALTQLINGESVTRPVTRPYGCAIKYAQEEFEERKAGTESSSPVPDTVSGKNQPAETSQTRQHQ